MKSLFLFLLAVFCVSEAFAPESGAQDSVPPRRRLGTLGSFIDDVDVVSPGYLIYAASTSYRRGFNNEDFEILANSFDYGLHPRVDLSLSFAFSNSRFQDVRVRSLSDTYIGAKFVARPAERGLGIAFAPILEILGEASIGKQDFPPTRVNAVLPVILQRDFEHFRLYGEAGYITRGTLFLTTAVDWTFAKRWGAAVIVSGSRAVRHQSLNREFNLNIARWDAVVGLNYRINDRFGIFANGGRTISRFDVNSALYQVTLGLTITQKIR